jgi:hypothetical protein
MYQVFFDDYPLYDPRADELLIRRPDVHLAVGEAGEMSFVIDPDHPYAWALSRLKGVVELRADGVPIYRGRITKDKSDFNLSREIETEGLLACLNDSVVPPFNFPGDWAGDAAYQAAASSGNVVAFFLGWLLDQHNSQVTSPAQRIQLGDVTVADPNNYLSRSSSEYSTTLATIRSKLEELLGGYLLVDYSGETTVLHYYADLPLINTQVVEYGENLLDLVCESDATETYTAILPLGADGLTLEELPDGEISPGYFKTGKIIYSEAAEDLYGCRIIRPVEWKDVTVPSNLRTKALAALSEDGTQQAQSITVKAVDLGSVKEEYTRDTAVAGLAVADVAVVDSQEQLLPAGVVRFVLGRYVEIRSTPHNFSALYPLMELDPDILDPGNTTIVFGSAAKSASGMAYSSQRATQEQFVEQQIALGQTQAILAEQQASLASQQDEVQQSVQEQVTASLQTAESIIFSALERYVETSNFSEYQETVAAELALLADELVLRFTEATDQTKAVDGDLQRALETLTKYFEFSQDGLTIRAGENSMELTLDNDLVIFRRNGRQFGWWDGVNFHTGNIVIGVEERAQFGSFAFIPRENGLSFLEVGG